MKPKRSATEPKSCLAAAKARETTPGSSRLLAIGTAASDSRLAGLVKARGVAMKAKQEKAAEAYADLLPAIGKPQRPMGLSGASHCYRR